MIYPLSNFTPISSRAFTWNNNPRENPHPMGIIEDSDWRDQGGHEGVAKQVFDDACDKGFVVRSERTQEHVLYVFDRRIDNPREPGEVQVWVYKAHKQWRLFGHRWVNPTKITEIHVLND